MLPKQLTISARMYFHCDLAVCMVFLSICYVASCLAMSLSALLRFVDQHNEISECCGTDLNLSSDMPQDTCPEGNPVHSQETHLAGTVGDCGEIHLLHYSSGLN